MRTLGINQASRQKGQKIGKTGQTASMAPKRSRFSRLVQAALPLIIVAAVSATVSALISRNIILASVAKEKETAVAGASTDLAKTSPPPAETPANQPATGGEEIIRIAVPAGSSVNVRETPSLDGKIILRLTTSQEAVRVGEDADWSLVAFKDKDPLAGTVEGWVYSQFIVSDKQDSSTDEPSAQVAIGGTPTGWLRVRATPSTAGEEVAKVIPGETYPLLDSRNGWFQIELPEGLTGWVSGEYASVE
jgi:uncharacterized protein YgiM (DUF1202 family)